MIPIKIGSLELTASVKRIPNDCSLYGGRATIALALTMSEDDARALEDFLSPSRTLQFDPVDVLPHCSRAATLRYVDALRLQMGESLAQRNPDDA
jgi:hypothetical protein